MKKGQVISIRLTGDVLGPLDKLVELNRTTRTRVIERALAHFLSQRAMVQHEIIWRGEGRSDAC